MKRVTLRDLAAAAGVSVATVSLALRGDRRLPEKTRTRFHRLAKRMGYRPDPMLSALSAYRSGASSRGAPVIAWLTAWPAREGWHARKTFASYYAGAAKQAEQLGYRLEHFWTGDHGGANTSRVLWNRSIRAVIAAPLPEGIFELDFDFRPFHALQIGRSLHRPRLSSVTHNHYASMLKLLEILRERGYRRIGFSILDSRDRIQDYRWSGALLAFRERFPRLFARTPFYHPEKWEAGKFAAWVRNQRCDAVISDDPHLYRWLPKGTRQGIGKIGFACLAIEEREAISGIFLDATKIGAWAVTQMHALLVARGHETPDLHQSVVLEGVWHEGRTLPSLRQGPRD